MTRPTRIELHDARIAEIALRPGDSVAIRFSHLSGFVPTRDGRCMVWSCAATLRLAGVTRLALSGETRSDDYVTDGALRSGGAELDPSALLVAPSGPGELELLLAGSGAIIRASFAECALESIEPLRELEEWTE